MIELCVQKVHRATLRLLECIGVGVDSDAALGLLSDHGIRVDWQRRRVHPDEEQVQRALRSLPRRITIYGRSAEHAVILDGNATFIMSGGASLRVHTLDGGYEAATWEHLRQFNVLLDALPNVHMCVNQVDPTDEPQDHFYRRLAAEMFITCRKPLLFQVGNAADVAAMVEMGSVVRGSRAALQERPLFMVGLNAEPPLHIPRGVAEALLAASAAGMPLSLGHYGMAGVTVPATILGAVVHLNAVQLVACVLSQLVRPGAPVCYTGFSGVGNMRTLDVASASPHALRIMLLATQMGRFYGLPVYVAATSDAHQPDSQAACERATQVYALAQAGASLIQGPTSTMEQFMVSSFTQAVIDNEILDYVLAALAPPDETEEALALEATAEVLTDPWLKDLKFVGHPHTARHLHEIQWQPRCFDYANPAAWQRAGALSVVARATAVARNILERHWVEELPPAMAAELRRIAIA
ncbi:MAG: trimethylamine methyltransferase family protein [Anaerolineae bacterium]|nr:trimethylamine methyltransferase family protein [Anaerolineae bacterium]MDW8070973.1 trimethylamine methyltransferase family protein [Anaerolineae bacterium]